MSINELFLTKDDTIRVALERIENSHEKIILIIDDTGQLAATVTDGDIRRGLLNGHTLDSQLSCVMSSMPVVAREGEDLSSYMEDMKNALYRHLPIVDSNKKVIKIVCFNDVIQNPSHSRVAVVMAGGLGQRLRPWTEHVPKPMLEIDGQPMLLRLVKRLKEHNITNIYLSINYRKEVIQNFFGNGEKFGVKINYIVEDERLGTAGALGLLTTIPTEEFLVLNADLVTKINFNALLDFHREHQSMATVCIRKHHMEIPYGVVSVTDEGTLSKIVEKPSYEFLINTGIYVFDPKVFSLVKKGVYLDMPQLLRTLVEAEFDVRAFVAYEQWLDVGSAEDMQRAKVLAY